MKLTLSTLCPEVKLLILNYLEIDELLTLSAVSKNWYQFVSSDAVWHERFRRFNAKLKPLSPLPPDSDSDSDEPLPRLKRITSTGITNKATPPVTKPMYKISKTLNAKQLREVKACKFISVNKVKLAFFLNKTGLLFNRLSEIDDITQYSHSYVNYYYQDDEELVWNNHDERTQFQNSIMRKLFVVDWKIPHNLWRDCGPNVPRFEENSRFKIYNITSGSGFGYKIIHLQKCNLEEQIIDAGVTYTRFLSSDRFLLCHVTPSNGSYLEPSESIIHVYRFSYETGQFKLTSKLDMSPDIIDIGAGRVFLNDKDNTVMVKSKSIWLWDLCTGKKMGQANVSDFVNPAEKLREVFPVGARRMALLLEYHTKKYVQQKVILLDLETQKKLWETKLNCLQSFMKLHVTCQYVIVLRNKKTEDYQLSFVVYDVNTGSKLYEVPYHMEYYDFRGCFFPLRGDIMIVLSQDNGFSYYDLKNQTDLNVTFENDQTVSAEDSSSEDDEYDDYFPQDRQLSLYDGPGDTIIQCIPTNKGDMAGHEMFLRLVDYRNNRTVRVARFEGLKIWRHQVGWSKDLSQMVEYYDPHICGTNVYRIW